MIRPYLSSLRATPELENFGTIHPPHKMRAVLEIIAPQLHEGDHETTAEILHTGSQDSLAMELGRLLIYLLTNNMYYRFRSITGCRVDLQKPSALLGLLRSVGLLTKANIDRLRRSENDTSQVFLELLLANSILDHKSFDILGWLVPSHFDVDHSVQHPDNLDDPTEGNLLNLLQIASLGENVDAVRLLLDLGADPYDNGGRRNFTAVSPLELAACSRRHNRGNAIAELLLSRPTTVSSELKKKSLEAALHLAIKRSNTELMMTLFSESQYLGHGTTCSQCLGIAARYGNGNTFRLLVGYYSRGGTRSLILPKDILFSVINSCCHYDDADLVVDKLNYFLELGAETDISWCCDVCDQAFAGFALENVVGIRFGKYLTTSGTFELYRYDFQLKEDCILKLAKTFREHGCPPERPKSTSEVNRNPSALQLAIFRRYSRVVEYLLEWGAEIDYHYQSNHPRAGRCQHFVEYEVAASGRSPLLTALETQQADIAKLLLTRKPNLRLHGGELTLALRIDDPDLITMLLQAGSSDMNDWKDVLKDAVLRRSPQSIRLLMSMEARGHATIDNVTALRAALITGDHHKAYQQLESCDYDSWALFEAVVQSHRSEDYRPIVEQLLETRPKTPNDGFEVRAVASAAAHQDMYLMNVLMRSFGQGPWTASFPEVGMIPAHGTPLCYWAPKEDKLARSKHIFDFAVELHTQHNNLTVIATLLEFNVPAKGMDLDICDKLTSETLKQLIAAGANANANAEDAICRLIEENKLAHVEVLIKAKVLLNRMHMYWFGSLTAVQAAFEFGSPEMLQMLLDYGGDVNYPAGFYWGRTCLHIAVENGNIGLVRFLLDKGADVNAKRSLFKGRTAIEFAAENGRLDVLKLLLLQKKHLFRTDAERYQFVRAVKFAEAKGRGPLVTMLKQHINWNSNDQRRLDEMWLTPRHFDNICLDEMTQEPLDEEKQNPDFWEDVCEASYFAGLKNVKDIVGIEKWIGNRREEHAHDWAPSETTGNPEEGDLLVENSIDRGHQATYEVTLAAKRQARLQTDLGRPGEFMSSYNSHDTFIDQVDLPSGLMCEQAILEWPAWRLNSETGESTQTLAPRALRYRDYNPMWLDMEDNDIDSMMQDVSGGLGTQSRMVETLAHQPATQNVDRESGMVLGEVLDDAPHINDMGDDAVVHNGVGDIGEAENSHMSQFNWGLWDDELFEYHSAAWENWNIGSGTAS